jgi:hypothetical protein
MCLFICCLVIASLMLLTERIVMRSSKLILISVPYHYFQLYSIGRYIINVFLVFQLRRNDRANDHIDGKDERNSNWLRFVNCARHESEQNVMPYQYKGNIWYKTRRSVIKSIYMFIFKTGSTR